MTFLLTALTFYPMLVGVLEKRAEIGLAKQAWEIAHTIRFTSPLPNEQNLPLTILLMGRSVESNYLLIDSEDKISFSSKPEQFPVGQFVAQLPDTLREDISFNRNQANVFKNEHYLSAEVPASSEGTVLTFVSARTLKTMYRETLLMIFGSLLLALTIALIIAFFLIHYLVKPIRALENYAQAVGNRQFDNRLEVRSDDELAQLGTAFNQMADRLKSYDESRRRFFQNASHEMKTPLMSISGYAEGIRDGLFTGPALENAIDIIHKESLRLKNIVENMIDITILEQPHNIYSLPHDLHYLMEQAVDTASGYAVEKRVEIEYGVANDTWVIGDWDQLHSLFVNLLSNAVRHARSTVTIISTLINNNRQVSIKIQDNGPGFSSEDLEHAFDYFYSTAKSGSGLGLTIVQKIVEEHAGTIKLSNTPDGGGLVEVVLPTLHEGNEKNHPPKS
ncbi:MAG: HAMP domain-containing sensor histidine kinase [Syntrophomonas sp.]